MTEHIGFTSLLISSPHSLSRVSLSALASTGDFAHLWIAVEEDEWE
jgi:hypothetical protein